MPTVRIHAGQPHAASSSIQAYLELNRPQLATDIYIPPGEGGMPGLMPGGGQALFAFVEVVQDGSARQFVNILREADGRDIAISSEFASELEVAHWQIFHRHAQSWGFDIKVHIIIRETADRFVSKYSQAVSRAFETRTIDELIQANTFRQRSQGDFRADVWREVSSHAEVLAHRFGDVVNNMAEWVTDFLCNGARVRAATIESWDGSRSRNRALRDWELRYCRLWNQIALHSQTAKLETLTLGEALKHFPACGPRATLTKHQVGDIWLLLQEEHRAWACAAEVLGGFELEFLSEQILLGLHDLEIGFAESRMPLPDDIILPEGASEILQAALGLVGQWNLGATVAFFGADAKPPT